jgi:hypothetical protein
MKKIIFVSKMCKLNAKSRAKIANVNAPLGASAHLVLQGCQVLNILQDTT